MLTRIPLLFILKGALDWFPILLRDSILSDSQSKIPAWTNWTIPVPDGGRGKPFQLVFFSFVRFIAVFIMSQWFPCDRQLFLFVRNIGMFLLYFISYLYIVHFLLYFYILCFLLNFLLYNNGMFSITYTRTKSCIPSMCLEKASDTAKENKSLAVLKASDTAK